MKYGSGFISFQVAGYPVIPAAAVKVGFLPQWSEVHPLPDSQSSGLPWTVQSVPLVLCGAHVVLIAEAS